jgi:vancomycin resistance protein VanW
VTSSPKRGLKLQLRALVRNSTPGALRITVANLRRTVRDAGLAGRRPRLVGPGRSPPLEHQVAEVTQDIKGSSFIEGKLANIRLGAERLDGVVVQPGETLSFWKLVGRPTAGAGFAMGRTIRGGTVSGELGGGLCQLSGIVYEAGLRAGLRPVERYPHSRDLYAEAERFTPLGLDATVVWPYKDLRLANTMDVPVQFRFLVGEETISASVHAAAPLKPATLEVARTDGAERRQVRVVRRAAGGEAEPISDDVYLLPAPTPS